MGHIFPFTEMTFRLDFIKTYLKGGVVFMNFFKEAMSPSSSPGGNKPDCMHVPRNGFSYKNVHLFR
jgi:hypothetical protein